MNCIPVKLREATRKRIDDLIKESCPGNGPEAEICRQHLHEVVHVLGKVEVKAKEVLCEEGFNVDEVNTAYVEDNYVYTGDWVGVVTLDVEGICFNVIISPKVLWFKNVVDKTVRVLRTVGVEPILARLEASLMRAGLVRVIGAILASMYIEEWAQNKGPNARNLSTIAHMVYAAFSNVMESLRELKGLEWVASGALAALKPLANNPVILRALTQPVFDEPELEPVEEVAILARSSTKLFGAEPLSTTMLLPSPKLFELAILATILETLTETGCKISEVHRDRVVLEGCKATSVYFNTSPSSKLVKRLSMQTPKPDIVVELEGHQYILVEAKYRLVKGKPLLPLADAMRLAAYIQDLEPQATLIVYAEVQKQQVLDNPLIIVCPFHELKETLNEVIT